jgi:hypothetical protein
MLFLPSIRRPLLSLADKVDLILALADSVRPESHGFFAKQ